MMQRQGPFCQSCAMPQEKLEMFGTNTDGSKSEEYRTYCLSFKERNPLDFAFPDTYIHRLNFSNGLYLLEFI